MTKSRWRAVFLAGVLMATALPAAGAEETVILEGLAGPLGLAVADDGRVLVTEAFGPGRLTLVDPRGNVRVLVEEPGTELAGVDVADGQIVYTQTVFSDPIEATVNRVSKGGTTQVIASTQAFEEANNPDGNQKYGFVRGANQTCLEQFAEAFPFPPVYTGIVESHPYAVAIRGSTIFLADAAGNTLLEVSGRGSISTLAVFRPVPQTLDEATAEELGIPACAGETYFGEPVPTDVEIGPDGFLYVSLLPGAPEMPGAGQIWKVHRATGDMTMVADGLTGAVDIAVAANGDIFVAELFADQISVVSSRGRVSFYTSLAMPGAIEITEDGTIYATKDVFIDGAVVKLGS